MKKCSHRPADIRQKDASMHQTPTGMWMHKNKLDGFWYGGLLQLCSYWQFILWARLARWLMLTKEST